MRIKLRELVVKQLTSIPCLEPKGERSYVFDFYSYFMLEITENLLYLTSRLELVFVGKKTSENLFHLQVSTQLD